MTVSDDSLARAVEAMTGARRVAVLTGAGMSAESGVPTFREALTGLWSQFEAQRLATPEGFAANPALVFGWYLSRVRMVLGVSPHEGYHALVRMESRYQSFTVVTQNIDGLHARAGSGTVVELHGSLRAFRCFACGEPYPFDRITRLATEVTDAEVDPPDCGVCGGPVRPGVVWFGEMLPSDATERAWQAAAEADVFVVVGTSSIVYPAAGLPSVARQHGATVIDINPDESCFSAAAEVRWLALAGEALPALSDALTTVT